MIARIRRCLLCGKVPTKSKTVALVEEGTERATTFGTEKIDAQVESQKELVENKVADIQQQAMEGFNLNSDAPESAATFDEYKLKSTTDKTTRELEMAQSIGFSLMHLGLAVAVAADYTHKISVAVCCSCGCSCTTWLPPSGALPPGGCANAYSCASLSPCLLAVGISASRHCADAAQAAAKRA